MNNKPQQPRFDVGKLNLPKDIFAVIERLKEKGAIKVTHSEPVTWKDTCLTRKTERRPCKWCGKDISTVFKHHICKTQRLNLKPLLLALVLPLCAFAQPAFRTSFSASQKSSGRQNPCAEIGIAKGHATRCASSKEEGTHNDPALRVFVENVSQPVAR